jgi:DNA-binding transcriptional LysR family regulator
VTDVARQPLTEDEFAMTHLLDERLLLAVAASDPLAGREAVRLEEVDPAAFVVGAPDDEAASLRAWEPVEFAPRARMVVPGWLGKLACVAAGLGVAVVPELVAPALPPGIRLLALDPPGPVRRVHAVTVRGRTGAPLVGQLIGHLREAGRQVGGAAGA